MHVITPPGDMLGFVDVTVFDTMTVIDAIYNTYNSRTLIDGYEYVADIELTDVDPDNGFILGDPLTPIPPDVFNFVNTPVTLTGAFPVFASIATAEAAYAAYGVYFGPRRPDRRAFLDIPFPPARPPEPMHGRARVAAHDHQRHPRALRHLRQRADQDVEALQRLHPADGDEHPPVLRQLEFAPRLAPVARAELPQVDAGRDHRDVRALDAVELTQQLPLMLGRDHDQVDGVHEPALGLQPPPRPRLRRGREKHPA